MDIEKFCWSAMDIEKFCWPHRLATCPISNGRTITRMTESGFKKLCSHKQTIDESYCQEICKGKNIPESIEFMELEDFKNSEEVVMSRSAGVCTICARTKTVEKLYGRVICQNCGNIIRAIKQTPELVVAEMKEVYTDEKIVEMFGIKLSVSGDISQPSGDDLKEKVEELTVEICNIGSILQADPDGDVVSAAINRMEKIDGLKKSLQRDAEKIANAKEILGFNSDDKFLDSCLIVKRTLNYLQEEVKNGIRKNQEITTCPSEALYAPLRKVLNLALDQAENGKGKERHAKAGEPFYRQKICEITRRTGLAFPVGQAIKKAEEIFALPTDAGMREILGAINYLAAAHIVMEEQLGAPQ